MAKKKKTKRHLKSFAEKLIDAALIWHGATVLNGQCDKDSRADSYLRKHCVRFLKKHPNEAGVRLQMVRNK